MGGRVGSSWNLVVMTCQSDTTITSGWPTCGWLTSDQPTLYLATNNPLTSGPIGRSTSKWSTYMSPTSI